MKESLWPERWPSIALQECIDKVEVAQDIDQVIFELPCSTCPEAGRCLTAKRKEIGSLLYGRELLSDPKASESSFFPFKLFEPGLLHDREMLPSWRKPYGMESRFTVVQAWDFAYSEKVGGDWLVCITAFYDREKGIKQILEIDRWQQVSFQQQCQLIEDKWRAFDADLVVMEADAAQQIWFQHMRANHSSVPVMRHTASEKRDFKVGVPGLVIQLENREWRFPYKQGTYKHAEMQNFFDEAEAFSWIDGKLGGVGEHDDTVMAWWHLAWGMSYMTKNG